MKWFAIRTGHFAIRNLFAPAFCLTVIGLLVMGARSTGLEAESAESALAALALLCCYMMLREARARRHAREKLQRLYFQMDARVEERAIELAKAGERYVKTLDQMLAGCQLIGFDWRYLYVNDAIVKQGRKSREERIGHTMMEVYPGFENTRVFAVLRRCMEDRTPQHVETDFTFPDGTKGWFQLSVQAVPEGIFIVSIEITERKLAEMNVQRQLARLQSLRAIDLSILGTSDLHSTLATVLEEARARLHVDGAHIRLFNPDTQALEVVQRIGTVHEPNGSAYSTPLIAKEKLVGTFDVTFRAPFQADEDWLAFFEAIAGQAAMAIESRTLFEDLQRTNRYLQLAYDTTIEGWSRALDLRDKETEGHTQRVTEMTVKLARRAGMSEEELVHVRRGALLHDIGKLGVPDHILLKPGKLTDEEWVIMRMHPTYAYDMLKPIEYLREALDIPYCHHEKLDGSGYPRGLKGDQIPLAARLFAVVDVWDAIRSDRPYRKGWPDDKVLEHIRAGAGTHFDPLAVELFLRVMSEEKPRQPDEQLVEG